MMIHFCKSAVIMTQNRTVVDRIYGFFASMRLSLFLFGALAITSIFGTLIPQEITSEQRLRQFGPKLNALIELLDLGDMYHSWWFRLLLILLSANLIVCSMRRLPKTLKALRAGRKMMTPSRIEKMHLHGRVELPTSPQESKTLISNLLSSRFTKCVWQQQEGQYFAVAEKGRWGRLGVYFVHLSVLLVFAGALVGSLFGFRGFMTIPEKTSESHVHLRREGQVIPLDFEVRCDKFTVAFYDNGSPKEFRSDVSILVDGRVVKQAAIRVNDPFTFRGINFYQSTYGSQPTNIVLKLENVSNGKSQQLEVPFRQPITIPGSKDRLVIMDYADNIGNFGPAFYIGMARENQEPDSGWIVAKQPGFHGNRLDGLRINVLKYANSYYTGLEVKKDPGVWLIYLGFVLMLLSLIFALYQSHRRVWLALTPGQKGTAVHIAGNTNKHALAFEKDFQQLVHDIENMKPDSQRT
ncbi:MAG: cytochrome c biogenesis protein ResB [Deltaproteobacteria bacterium]|nr:cytochrome c biogenesis protein ResB [Deltaproteobacteria bacterium]MBW2072791.1 cytochrome c biogenesis protein ResB [Deltaproteobacteria bacterium]